MTFDLLAGKWLNKPRKINLSSDVLKLTTEPGTDFWQRSYYGFRNENAPALLFESSENFTFSVRVSFKYQTLFDQCGLIVYLDNENWFKASIEHEDLEISRMGSVVTNLGYSDWATTDIDPVQSIWYRLSRRGPDFLIESSVDGEKYKQMRIFHLHKLGETTNDMGKANPPLPPIMPIKFGLYACSPSESSFEAEFSQCRVGSCSWKAHE